MSHVTAVLLFTDSDSDDLLAAVNAFAGLGAPVGLQWLTAAFGGTKHPQVDVAGAGVNYLSIPDFLAHLRGINWSQWDCAFVQVAMQDEHDTGLGLVDIYRTYGVAWSEGDR